MDISFHYFAVKTIARYAGFDDSDAQLIAEYSQFVDDYTVWMNYGFKEVPDYAASLRSQTKTFGFWSFYTVTTGFESYPDLARLMIEKYQREIVLPFHFIPYSNIHQLPGDREDYRTSEADITGGSLVARLLRDARDRCIASIGTDEHHYDLMRVGVLLHVFADTYAHSGFSGLHGWENFCYITDLRRTQDQTPVHDENTPEFYAGLYALGHAEAGHAPDMPYAYFEYTYATSADETSRGQYTGARSRNNTNTFLQASKQIFTVLYQITHDGNVPTEEEWIPVQEVLVDGFRIEGTDFDHLSTNWKNVAGIPINFEYSAQHLWQDQLIDPYLLAEKDVPQDSEELSSAVESANLFGYYRTATDDFFHYNLIAKEIRDAVIERQ